MNRGGHVGNGSRALAIVAAGAVVVAACAIPVSRTDPAEPGIGGDSANSTLRESFVTVAPGVEEPTNPSVQAVATGGETLDGGSDDSSVVLNLDVGTCFDDLPAGTESATPDSVPVVDCAAAHDNEVFASFDVGSEGFPGADEIQVMSVNLCFGAFESYVGAQHDTGVYDVSWYFPTRESWDVGGTNIICFAYNVELTKISGSIIASDR